MSEQFASNSLCTLLVVCNQDSLVSYTIRAELVCVHGLGDEQKTVSEFARCGGLVKRVFSDFVENSVTMTFPPCG